MPSSGDLLEARLIEGWSGDRHYVLFSSAEAAQRTIDYRVDERLPGYRVVGLLGWDDLILSDKNAQLFTVPTVPMSQRHLREFAGTLPTDLSEDRRIVGRIKWYVTPLVFGGDPKLEGNVTWVDHQQHSELVRWWNDMYQAVSQNE